MTRLLPLLILAACCDEDPPEPEPLFPADYAASFTEVRSCRRSADHDLTYVRVLADAAAAGPYVDRDRPIPEGSIVLKEEFDFADAACSGGVVSWTVMQRLATGSSGATLDWRWQQVSRERQVASEDARRCVACHESCVPPDGYENTCAVP